MFAARSGFANNKWQCTQNDFRYNCAGADMMLSVVKKKMEAAEQKAQLKAFERK